MIFNTQQDGRGLEPRPFIVIFTNTFPYGTGETFFEMELPYLLALKHPVILAPLYGTGMMRTIPSVPEAPVSVAPPLLSFDPKDKFRLFCHGLFNGAPLFFALRDFFTAQIWRSRKKTWSFGVSFLLLRALHSKNRLFFSQLGKAHLYFYWADKTALILPFLANKGKVVVRFHGSDLYEEVKGCLPFRKRIFPHIDLACPTSQHGADYLRARYGSTTPPLMVARLGTPDYGLGPEPLPTAPFHIVSCANVISLKRIELILQALTFIHRPVSWTHIGDGPLRHHIEKAAQEAGLSVHFCGALPHEAVMEFYKNTSVHLFVSTSRSEGVPVSMMEAMSFGIPVMATAVGGVPELVSDRIGVLLPANPLPEEIAQKLSDFIHLPQDTSVQKRQAARTEWENRWSAQKNYPLFCNTLIQF